MFQAMVGMLLHKEFRDFAPASSDLDACELADAFAELLHRVKTAARLRWKRVIDVACPQLNTIAVAKDFSVVMLRVHSTEFLSEHRISQSRGKGLRAPAQSLKVMGARYLSTYRMV